MPQAIWSRWRRQRWGKAVCRFSSTTRRRTPNTLQNNVLLGEERGPRFGRGGRGLDKLHHGVDVGEGHCLTFENMPARARPAQQVDGAAGDHVAPMLNKCFQHLLQVCGDQVLFDEPIARGGPFVMNTKEEIVQAFDDYRYNRF